MYKINKASQKEITLNFDFPRTRMNVYRSTGSISYQIVSLTRSKSTSFQIYLHNEYIRQHIVHLFFKTIFHIIIKSECNSVLHVAASTAFLDNISNFTCFYRGRHLYTKMKFFIPKGQYKAVLPTHSFSFNSCAFFVEKFLINFQLSFVVYGLMVWLYK